MLVHLLIIPLRCPDTIDAVFSKLFELVAFDIFPTDEIYGAIFQLSKIYVKKIILKNI